MARQYGGTELGADYTPLGTTDFSAIAAVDRGLHRAAVGLKSGRILETHLIASAEGRIHTLHELDALLTHDAPSWSDCSESQPIDRRARPLADAARGLGSWGR